LSECHLKKVVAGKVMFLNKDQNTPPASKFPQKEINHHINRVIKKQTHLTIKKN